jgi:hypothetical protein
MPRPPYGGFAITNHEVLFFDAFCMVGADTAHLNVRTPRTSTHRGPHPVTTENLALTVTYLFYFLACPRCGPQNFFWNWRVFEVRCARTPGAPQEDPAAKLRLDRKGLVTPSSLLPFAKPTNNNSSSHLTLICLC